MNEVNPAATPVAEPQPSELALAEPVTGIVLAGGRSTRMGRDKAWVEVAGRPMIAWVLEAVQAVAQYTMIVSRRSGHLQSLGVPVVEDRYPARGPLTGVHAGLKAAPTELCLVVACDLPLVQPALLSLLAASCGPAHAAVPYVMPRAVPSARPLGSFGSSREAGLQPLCAAYRRACLAPLEKLLAGGGSVPAVVLVSVVKARIIGPEEWRVMDPHGRSFYNVNRPEDVTAAAGILAGHVGG